MSIGMFSILPVPKKTWDERSLGWVIPWMPVVGGLIGLLWFAVAWLTTDWPPAVRAALVMLTPFVLSGFIHLDGFMDTADAWFSRRGLEEKKRILKDSHVGAFAVIAVACLFLLQYSAIETILAEKKSLLALIFIPILSRNIVGLQLLSHKAMSETGFAAMFKTNTGKRHYAFIGVLFAVAVIVPAFCGLDMGTATTATTVTGMGVMALLISRFQGVSGDLCGCAITLSELAGLLILSLRPALEAMRWS